MGSEPYRHVCIRRLKRSFWRIQHTAGIVTMEQRVVTNTRPWHNSPSDPEAFCHHYNRRHRRHCSQKRHRKAYFFRCLEKSQQQVKNHGKQDHLHKNNPIKLYTSDISPYVNTGKNPAQVNHGQRGSCIADLLQSSIQKCRQRNPADHKNHRKKDRHGRGFINFLGSNFPSPEGVVSFTPTVHRDQLIDDRKYGNIKHTVLREYAGNNRDSHKSNVPEQWQGHDRPAPDHLLHEQAA